MVQSRYAFFWGGENNGAHEEREGREEGVSRQRNRRRGVARGAHAGSSPPAPAHTQGSNGSGDPTPNGARTAIRQGRTRVSARGFSRVRRADTQVCPYPKTSHPRGPTRAQTRAGQPSSATENGVGADPCVGPREPTTNAGGHAPTAATGRATRPYGACGATARAGNSPSGALAGLATRALVPAVGVMRKSSKRTVCWPPTHKATDPEA